MTPSLYRSVFPSIHARIEGEASLAAIAASNNKATEELPIKIIMEGKNFCRMGLVLQAIYDIVPRFACHNVYAGPCGVRP